MEMFVLCFLIGFGQFAQANRRVSIAELNRVLIAQCTAHTADAESAKLLEGLELSERLTPSALQRILSACTPGPQVMRALNLLADTSAFFNPPASEFLPHEPDPNRKKQLSLISEAVDFVAVTLQHLPDFVVTRNTQSFDNASTNLSQSGRLILTDSHTVDTSSREIVYRDGREVMEKAERGEAHTRTAGLQTWGEFGPILATVLHDAVKGQIVWDHWEAAEDDKTLAVFRYSVPRRASHYRLNYCCTFNAWVEAPSDDYRDTPAYHGALALDPESGAIRRITVEAAIIGTEVVERADIAVEYGNADIGGRSYICPLRSLALSVDHYHPGVSLQNPIARINEVRFVNYHKAGSQERADTIMAMEQLAEETGGEAFFNTNALDTAAARAVANGASYYTIGYSPTNEKMDGQYRRIEVTVRGKYGLSYRRGYFADSKPAKTADTESGKKSVPPASR